MIVQVLTPKKVSSNHDIRWDEEADVVIVGLGGAGVVAALQALETNVQVLAIDRFSGGGATAFSGGVFYAGGTRHQAEAGFKDEPEDMFAYLRAEGTPLSDRTLLRYCQGSSGDLEWVASHGVPFGSNVYVGKTAFPPDPHWLYFSGNENTPKFKAVARPAPRGHRTVTPGQGGHKYFAHLQKAAVEKGLRLLKHHCAEQLIVDAPGRVIGVQANALPEQNWEEHDTLYKVINPWKPFNNKKAEQAIAKARELEGKNSRPRMIRARKGVILTTGGFVYNLEMLRAIRPIVGTSYQGLLRLGSMGCDGSGIRLGQSVGGSAKLLTKLFIGSPLSPPVSFIKGVIVKSDGKRFINEDAYHSKIGDYIADESGDGCAWLILDGAALRKAVKEAFFPGKGMFMLWGAPALLNLVLGGTKRAGNVSKLAKRCGIDAAVLERTLAEYNTMAAAGGPDPLGKSNDKLRPLDLHKLYAINLAVGNRASPTMCFTLGGLIVNEDSGAVEREDGSAIPGLYAAGRAAVGLCSEGYVSGMSIADTAFSGRRAGRSAAS